MEEVTFLPCWLQGRVSNPREGALQENVAKGKRMLLLPLAAEYISWIKEVNHLSMESNVWSLNIEMVSMVSFILFRRVESNLCRIAMNSGTQWYSMWNQIWMISACNVPETFVCFPSGEHAQMGVFLMNFMRFGCLCFASHSHLGSVLESNIYIWQFGYTCARRDNDLLECVYIQFIYLY